jgi:chromosomal replication initiator protein
MDTDSVWNEILNRIKTQTSVNNFKAWFSQTQVQSIDNDTVKIKVPSSFHKSQLLSRYESIILSAGSEVLGREIKLEFIIDPGLLKKASPPKQEAEEDFFSVPQTPVNRTININPKYTLDNFVVGLTNNLAFAAAQAVVENPGTTYNPLFIYGPSGVGKTHLMHAIANALISKNPDIKPIFASSERFMNDFVESIKSKSTLSFRHKYRSCDILLLDDIQFISGKDSTQEEFFHTFNDLHSKNSQLVFTSDRPPNEIEKLESRLASRFQGGLMVDVQLPDFDTRMAILKAKLSEKRENLPEEFLMMIAERIISNTRELEGKLTQILQRRKLLNKPLTEEEIIKVLGGQPVKTQELNPEQILNGTVKFFNISLADITGPRRQKELVLPRQIAMFLMYSECRMPFEKIGELLGGRDHTTVMHGVDKIKESSSRDREVQRLLFEIKQHLNKPT